MLKYYNGTIRNLTNRLRKFKDILDEELQDAIIACTPEITDAIREQMYNGVDGSMNEIKPPYTARTVKNKIRKGQPTNRVTLKDSGDFYKSLVVIADHRGFIVSSEDPKVNLLVEKYGDKIFMLSDFNFTEIVREQIRPILQQRIKERITGQ